MRLRAFILQRRDLPRAAYWSRDRRPDCIAVDVLNLRALGWHLSIFTTRPGHDGKACPAPRFQLLRTTP